jgi:hypothetical protein
VCVGLPCLPLQDKERLASSKQGGGDDEDDPMMEDEGENEGGAKGQAAKVGDNSCLRLDDLNMAR